MISTGTVRTVGKKRHFVDALCVQRNSRRWNNMVLSWVFCWETDRGVA